MALTKTHHRMIEGSTLNVIDFGADPTGTVDSSTAIQAAINYAATNAQSITYTSFAAQSVITVNFPPGLYKIDAAITIPNAELNYGMACTNGRATFVGANPATHKCFIFEQVRNITFENLNWIGFTTATEWDTNNVDSNLIRYINCEFINCGVGIDTVSYAQSRSTVLVLDKCRAGGTDLLMKSYCDMTIIRDGHFRNADANGAFILADSQLIIDGCLFTPYTSSATCRWIDITDEFSTAIGRTSAFLSNCRFGPEESGGIPVIYSSLSGDTGQSQRTTTSYITMTNCYSGCNNTGTPQGVIVLLNNSGGTATLAPNAINITGGSWNALNGAVVTESGLTTGYNVGQFVIEIDPTAQAGYGSSSTAPLRPLVESGLEQFLANSEFDEGSVTTTGSFTYAVGSRRTLFLNPSSAATLTDLTQARSGHEVTLIFANSNVTVSDVTSGGNFRLSGGSNFTSTANDTLTVVYNRGAGRWFEKSRSTN